MVIMRPGIEDLREEASWCWHYSTRVGKNSPLFDGVFEKIEGLVGDEAYKNIKPPTYEELAIACDRLVLVDDASVRVMVLKAMFLMHYISLHVGLIASFLGSEEKGQNCLFERGCMAGGEELLSQKANIYLNMVLDVGDTYLIDNLAKIFKEYGLRLGFRVEGLNDLSEEELFRSKQEREKRISDSMAFLDIIQEGWDEENRKEEESGVEGSGDELDCFYDYEQTYAPNPPLFDPDREDISYKEIDGEIKEVRRYLSESEYVLKQAKQHKSIVQTFYSYVSSHFYRCLFTTYITDRRKEAKKALELITRHALVVEEDPGKSAVIIDYLNKKAMVWKSFPESWLLEVAKKVINV